MCRAVKCKTCGKTTWSGCGQTHHSGQSRRAGWQLVPRPPHGPPRRRRYTRPALRPVLRRPTSRRRRREV